MTKAIGSSTLVPATAEAAAEGSPAEAARLALIRLAREALPPELQHLAEGPLAPALETAVEYTKANIAPNTERVYKANWSAFRTWAIECGAPYLPASPIVVAAYLAERARPKAIEGKPNALPLPGLGQSGLRLILASIAFYHRRSNHIWVANNPAVATVLKGILRKQNLPVRPAAALGTAELREILAFCGDDLAGCRDRALFLTGFTGALRRSELVALDFDHLTITREMLVLRIARSKTDQIGAGKDVTIVRGQSTHTCAVRAMEVWLRESKIQYGPVFRKISRHRKLEQRLSGDGVSKILKRLAEKVGFEVSDRERLSAHGLRAGFITEAYLNGALDEQVMEHVRHKSVTTTQKYRRRMKTINASPTRLLDN